MREITRAIHKGAGAINGINYETPLRGQTGRVILAFFRQPPVTGTRDPKIARQHLVDFQIRFCDGACPFGFFPRLGVILPIAQGNVACCTGRVYQ